MKEKLKVEDKRLSAVPETTELPVPTNPNAVILMAVQKNYSPEFIEKMMDLQERHEQNEARKAYVQSMAAFKADPPVIEKDRHVSYKAGGGQTEYSHASLGNVTEKINTGLGKHGLSAGWETKQENGNVTVKCKITHVMGHSEETKLSASPDTSGSKNPIQAIGSAISYLQRYTLLSLTGLATADMDDDGKSTGNGKISKLEEWLIKCDEAGECANKPEDMDVWWKKHGDTIKKELSTSDAANVYNRRIVHKKRLEKAAEKSEREPGQEG